MFVTARFEGTLNVRWLDDGRLMELLSPFVFHDANNVEWKVPKGTQTDGASIPQFLWTILGGPFEGKYRKAAVVHDYFCDVRTKPWRDVHRMFYSAMILSGVSERQAKILYLGVLVGGPRWSQQAIHNTRNSINMEEDVLKIRLVNSLDGLDLIDTPEMDADTVNKILHNTPPKSLEAIETEANNMRTELLFKEYRHLF